MNERSNLITNRKRFRLVDYRLFQKSFVFTFKQQWTFEVFNFNQLSRYTAKVKEELVVEYVTNFNLFQDNL